MDYLLLETGDKIILEHGTGFLLLETAVVLDYPTWDCGYWRRTYSMGSTSRTYDRGLTDRTWGQC